MRGTSPRMTSGFGCKIAVFGAGAIGCYFGGMLARAGKQVTLIGRREHVEAINAHGLFFKSIDFEEVIELTASIEPAALRDARLILFCVKSGDTDTAAAAIAPYVAPDTVLLSLQNGVDNIERIQCHLKNEVLAAVVYTGVEMSGPGRLTHTGGGKIVLGSGALVKKIADMFTRMPALL
jgi:2-dehydropantoate 2-reductase